jgi:hypothetical protein
VRFSTGAHGGVAAELRTRAALGVHDDGQEGMIDLEAAVVLDEPELLELVHEEVLV